MPPPTSCLLVDSLEAGVGWVEGVPLALLGGPLVLRPAAPGGLASLGGAGEAGDGLSSPWDRAVQGSRWQVTVEGLTC